MPNDPKKPYKSIPGVMIYTGSRPLLAELEPGSFKKLILAVLDYVDGGQEPTLTNAEERIAWAALFDHVQRDVSRYVNRCMTNRYARFLREAEKYIPKQYCPDYEEWLELSEEGARRPAEIMAACCERYLSLKSLPDTITGSNPATSPAAYPAPIASSKIQFQ